MPELLVAVEDELVFLVGYVIGGDCGGADIERDSEMAIGFDIPPEDLEIFEKYGNVDGFPVGRLDDEISPIADHIDAGGLPSAENRIRHGIHAGSEGAENPDHPAPDELAAGGFNHCFVNAIPLIPGQGS
jgi:hypothetical protein